MARKKTRARRTRAHAPRVPETVTVYFSCMRGAWPDQNPRKQKRYPVIFAAWWSGHPARDPFRAPDDSGTAIGREYVAGIVEAFVKAFHGWNVELVELPAEWVRAWRRMLEGRPPWPVPRGSSGPGPSRAGARAPRPKWAPTPPRRPGRHDWAERLGVTLPCTADEIARAYRKRAFECHPDRGGSAAEFVALTRAREAAMAHVGAA